jgi:tetratricopeptide (TPR) repeat protein
MTMRTFLVLSLLLCASAAADPRSEAKAHVKKATEHHTAGRFQQALDELLAAYKVDPQRDLLYAIAQVYAKLENCDDAVIYYELFLDTGPEAKATAAAREAIAACKQKIAAKPPEPPPPAPPNEPVAKPEPVVAPVQVDAPRRWYLDKLGAGLVGTGVLGGVVAVIFYRGASSDIDAAATATNYGESERLVDSASGKRTFAVIAGGAGIALLGAGVVRYVMVRGSAKQERRLSLVPTDGGAAITWGGRW